MTKILKSLEKSLVEDNIVGIFCSSLFFVFHVLEILTNMELAWICTKFVKITM